MKSLPLLVVKVSFTGFSPRTENGEIVQVAASVRVDYDAGNGHIESKDETIYAGDFKDIIGEPMPQAVKDALDTLGAHFGGLVAEVYGVIPA